NRDKAGNQTKTFAAGVHYLAKGKNINLKLDYLRIEQDGRKVNGAPAETYSEVVLAAQVAF
ncbi:hypothetical protein ACH0C8_16535, partial [Acetobacter lovaniensis]|uniref:hypothetical protein n=1 Tax=Acetobacter lovaniensis TaxID=104100 RepID=UPI00376FC54E